ncbi:MAG: hydroxymethylglutaryl-CoA lyase [Gammaproteobacteria bacterium]|nr:hydroxymethylglutaryl-CoA lyase [Gammaproteobacteria bacterium]
MKKAFTPSDYLPKKVKIVEVGPRDGLQNETHSLSVTTRLALINRLANAGLKHIEAGSFVHPKWVPQMADSDQVIKALLKPSKFHTQADPTEVHYPVLVPNLQGLQGALQSGAEEVAVFAAASESFTQKNINCSIEESIERFRWVIDSALQEGVKVRGYISCVMDCPYEGPVSTPKVIELASKLHAMGCYEISLGDTIGTGTPNRVTHLIERLTQNLDISQIAVHFHDTYGQALSNIYAALLCGVSTVDSSVAGLGGCPYAKGASGNVATEDVVYLLDGLGIEHGIDLDALIDAGRFICHELEKPVMSKVNLARNP